MGFQSCSSIKVLDTWKADKEKVESFKEQRILVIGRMADDLSRVTFENQITDKLNASGYNATASFSKFPKVHKEFEMTEERMKMMRSMIDSEGYTGVVITTVKDKKETTTTSGTGVYFGASYFPSYYGGFYNYYNYPYAYGNYYNGFGGYAPLSKSSHTTTTYILETVAYNLNQDGADQLIAVTSSSVPEVKRITKGVVKYVEMIAEALEKNKGE